MAAATRGTETVGFVGLGSIGAPMARRVRAGGFPLVGYDAAGTQPRLPAGGEGAESVADVARRADVVLLSLPDGPAALAVGRELTEAPERRTSLVVDLSTIGIEAATELTALLRDAEVAYVDAPVSGGVSGAEAGTLAVMAATASVAAWERAEPVLATFAAHRFLVGERPGQGQAMKVLNNFLSATAMAATSEALVFGARQGLDAEVMVSVLNASSGRNTATSDKFPRILAGEEALGFRSALMAKDVSLYREAALACDALGDVGELMSELWNALAEGRPESDFAAIWAFTRELAE